MSELSSIIIPVCNHAGLTRQCLESIFDDPPRVPFELIVVDDGSTDATSEVLASYGRSIRVVRRRSSGGFAPACNDGAAEATGEYLVFLNNDTIPQKGWLDVLVDYAESNSRAAVVGSKLLFPDGTVQHAGVIISQEGFPRHIYAGFPADHPAVNLSRRFVAVTFACALVRSREFEQVGGLDTDFRNSFEDVDICLRLQDKGREIHYCHKSVVYHLESVSRGRRNEHDRYNTRLLRERWGKRLKPNDFDYYLADGLLKINYPGTYPLRWEISPRLALHTGPGSVEEAAKLLDARSREVFTLLKETVRLTAHIAELELNEPEPSRPQEPAPSGDGATEPASTQQEIFAKVHDIEEEIYRLQQQLEAILQKKGKKDEVEPFTRSDDLGGEQRLKRIRELVTTTVPEEASVLVVSGGDPDLLKLNGREARHFPQGEQGSDMLSDPGGGAAAIHHLEELRDKGAEYLVFPVTGLWWLDRYPDFRKHLEERYETLIDEDDACLIFALA